MTEPKEGCIVVCGPDDSILIQGNRGLQIPAACVLAIDRLLRAAFNDTRALTVEPAEGRDGIRYWRADNDHEFGHGDTPWQAIMDLADEWDYRP